MKKYIKAKELLESNANNKEKKPIYATRKLSIGLVSCMLGLVMVVPMAHAEEEPVLPQNQQSEEAENPQTPAQDPVEEELLTEDEIQEIRNRTNKLENDYYFSGNMLEELKAELRKAKADPSVNYEEAKARLINEAIIKNTPAQKAPGEDRAKTYRLSIYQFDNIKVGATEITCKSLQADVGHTIKVFVGDQVRGTFKITQQEKRNGYKVSLNPAIAEGEKIQAVLYDKNDVKLAETKQYTIKTKKNEKYKDKLKMPTGDIWIADTASNLVDDFEEADALKLLKDANPTIANEIKSVEFKIKGTDPKTAYYIVTYTDGSKSEEIQAPGITVKKITAKSQVPTIAKTYVADGKITITLSENIAAGSKICLVQQFLEGDEKNFCAQEDDACSTGSCKADKSTRTWKTVEIATNNITYEVSDGFLELGRDFGVIVKEYRKLPSCNRTKPQIKIPNVPVRDPKKLTEIEKDKIREEIRKANTTNDGAGVSKLPDGNPGSDWQGIPAVIQIDDQGNVKIIDASDVKVKEWDNDGNATPETNEDGSPIFQEGKGSSVAETTTKEIVTNLPPNPPTVSYDKTKGEITVTPDKADTDAKTVVVKYQDSEGNKKTETVTKGDDGKWKVVEVTTENSKGEKTTEKSKDEGGEWKVPESSKVTVGTIDIENGEKLVTLKIKDSDIKNKTNVSATVTDEGGINTQVTGDDQPKKSENGSEEIKIYPKKPEIKVDDKTGDVTITPIDKDNDKVAKKMEITYTPAGKTETETVTVERKEDGTWTVPEGSDFKVSKDGKSITITNDKIKSKTDITAKTNDGDKTEKLESDTETKQVPNKTAPKPPTVEVNTSNGNAHITPPSDPNVKTIEVKYPGADGNEKNFTATKTDSGWEISGDNDVTYEMGGYISIPYNKLKKADTITAISIDGDGNKSTEGIDTSLPPAPTAKASDGVITVTPPENTPAVNGMEITYTPAGSEATKTFKVVKGNDDKWKIDGDTPQGVTVNENGTVTFAKGTAKEQTKVTAISSIDKTKKSLEKGEATVPVVRLVNPPLIDLIDDKPKTDPNYQNMTIKPQDLPHITTVNVTYTDAKGTSVKLVAKKGNDGQWSLTGENGAELTNGESIDHSTAVITIPKGKYKVGEKITAQSSDDYQNESTISKATPYQVTFDVAGANTSIESLIVQSGRRFKIPGPIEDQYAPSGKVFASWTIGGEKVDSGEPNDVNGNITVVATWKNKTGTSTEDKVKITFNGNGNSGTKTMPEQEVKKGTKFVLPENGFDPPAGKIFAGWKVRNENKKPGDSITVNDHVTVEAQWKDKPSSSTPTPTPTQKTEYKVRFDGNGANGSMTEVAVKEGKTYTLPGNGFEVPEGKEFTGWKIGGEDKEPGDTITVTKSITVVAQWKDKEKETPQQGNPEKPGENPEKPGKEDPKKPEQKPSEGKKNPSSPDKAKPAESEDDYDGAIKNRSRKKAKDGQGANLVKVPKGSRPNVKTGVESVAGIVCTLVASTGALYIGRKKED